MAHRRRLKRQRWPLPRRITNSMKTIKERQRYLRSNRHKVIGGYPWGGDTPSKPGPQIITRYRVLEWHQPLREQEVVGKFLLKGGELAQLYTSAALVKLGHFRAGNPS